MKLKILAGLSFLLLLAVCFYSVTSHANDGYSMEDYTKRINVVKKTFPDKKVLPADYYEICDFIIVDTVTNESFGVKFNSGSNTTIKSVFKLP